ncbi:MAG TPA: hypothetical protein VM050_03415 [Patescibacteria group bacterium]|nr:hypothetical protein [Patescibacteria group bacterium]
MSEMDSRLRLGALILYALLFASFVYIIWRVPFPFASYAHSELIPTQPSGAIGGAMSNFLWNFRGIDLMIQMVVLFVTAAACLAMLKEEK